MYCSSCGEKLVEGGRYCAHCGAAAESEAATSSTPPEATQEAHVGLTYREGSRNRIVNFREIELAFVDSVLVAESHIRLVESVPDRLDEGETLCVLLKAEAPVTGWTGSRRDTILVATEHRLLALRAAGEDREWELDDISDPQTELVGLRKTSPIRFSFQAGGKSIKFDDVIPIEELEGLIAYLEDENAGLPQPPLGSFAGHRVYPGELVSSDGERYPLQPDVAVNVGQAGELVANTRLSASRAVGGAVIGAGVAGPLGAIFGLDAGSQETIRDTREVYLLVEGDTWGWSVSGAPGRVVQLERFAQAIRIASRLRAEETSD